MRVCRVALADRGCRYGHLWAGGTPYAIHSHPRQGTAEVRDGRDLDRVLSSWPGYVEFEPGIVHGLRHSAVDFAGDPALQEMGLPDIAAAAPEAFARALALARQLADGPPSWLCAEPAWDDRMAGGTGKRCASESAGHTCELSAGHPFRHFSQGTSRSGQVIYTYAW